MIEIKVHDFYKNISPEKYRDDLIGGLMGAEEYLFRIKDRKKHGFFPGNDKEFNQCVVRAKENILSYKRRIAFCKKYIGKNVTAYEVRLLEGRHDPN